MKPNKAILFLLPLLLLAVTTLSKPTSSLNVSITGNGNHTAILIPGFTCSGEVWAETVEQLEGAGYTCHVITFSGFAGMPPQDDPHLKGWVSDIAAYIHSNNLNKPVVIGHSIGGVMAMMLASSYPALLSRIVVVDALPCLNATRNPSFSVDTLADCTPLIRTYIAMTDSALLAMQTQSMPMMCSDTTMHSQILSWSMKSDRKTMGHIYCEFLNTDLRESISGIKCPALVMLEAPFKMYDAVMQQQFAKLGDKTIIYAQKGLHFIMYDDKAWYLQQLTTFLP